MSRPVVPIVLIEALNKKIDSTPGLKEKVIYQKGNTTILFGDLPREIYEGTEIGINYEKALYKMAFESLVDGQPLRLSNE